MFPAEIKICGRIVEGAGEFVVLSTGIKYMAVLLKMTKREHVVVVVDTESRGRVTKRAE